MTGPVTDPVNGPARAPGPEVDLVRAALAAPLAPAGLPLPPDRVLAALAELRPEVLARFAGLGLDAGTARETLADVPRKVAAYGSGADVGWLLGLARADVVAVGRLQVARVAAAGGRALHVPESGPLHPGAVDASLQRAVALFGDAGFTCTSWLLDPLLPRALDAGGNIVAFAARFAVDPAEPGAQGDRAVARFVFRRPLAEVLDPALVHPRTRLEHVVAGHLRGGGHWSQPRGVLRG